MPFDNPYFPTQFDIGTPGAGHIHFSSNGSMTLFESDGVTVAASLDPVNGLQVFKGSISGVDITASTMETSTITSSVFRTAASPGQRVEITSAQNDRVNFYTGVADETVAGFVQAATQVAGAGHAGILNFEPSQMTGITQVATLQLETNSADLSVPRATAIISAGTITFTAGAPLGASHNITWDGATFAVAGNLSLDNNGNLFLHGSNTAYWFDDRDGVGGDRFALYANGGVARLFASTLGGDLLTVSEGSVFILNAQGSGGNNGLFVQQPGTGGFVALQAGSGVNTGYIEWYGSNSVRQGYLGFGGSNTGVSDNGDIIFGGASLTCSNNPAIRPGTDGQGNVGDSGHHWQGLWGSTLFLTGLGTGAGTTLVISGSTVLKLSSSEKYKTQMQPLTDPYRVLDLADDVITFVYKDDVTRKHDTFHYRQIGFTAETLHDKNFSDLLVYDAPFEYVRDDNDDQLFYENGSPIVRHTEELTPQSIQYDRVGVLLLPVVADLHRRLLALEGK